MSGTNGKRLLDPAAITGAGDLRYEDVEVPEWGGTVRLRVMTAGAREQWEGPLMAADPNKPPPHVRATMLALTMVNDQGELLFPDLAAGIAALEARDGTVIDRLVQVAFRINKLGREAVEAAGKGSEPSPVGSTTTA